MHDCRRMAFDMRQGESAAAASRAAGNSAALSTPARSSVLPSLQFKGALSRNEEKSNYRSGSGGWRSGERKVLATVPQLFLFEDGEAMVA